MFWLLDTNAVSRFGRRINRNLVARIEREAVGCLVSTVTWYELEYGVAKRPELTALRTRLELLREYFPEAVPFAEDAAFHAGVVRAQLERLRPNAQPIGPYDVLLAGQALSLGATLVTANVAEFSRVPGLVVENWES
jgi:tRNA(fMet)-specific endonuclease VapC